MGFAPLISQNAALSGALLRAPPFPDSLARSAQEGPLVSAFSPDSEKELLEALCSARVGGAFWGEPWKDEYSEAGNDIETVVRAAPEAEPSKERDPKTTRWLATQDGPVPIDPWSILPNAQILVAHGDDEWVALASALGLEIQLLSQGRYGKPGDSPAALYETALSAVRSPFADPFGDGWLKPLEAIALLADWRRVIDANRAEPGHRIVAACGMSWWKRDEIRRFLWSPGEPVSIHTSAKRALDAAAARGGSLAVWPSRVSYDLIANAAKRCVQLVRVEDGFVRSVGLGSNLVPPLSVIVDRQGIHYDPASPSDLETLLASTNFTPDLIARASRLRADIVDAGISKYAKGTQSSATVERRNSSKRRVLVPGQVEDDMSVLAGGQGLTSNLELLRLARALEPDAEIWWRPHPDVDAGHRKGAVEDAAALEIADAIVREGAMSDLLAQVDALHTITSLSGFEALLRGCEVTCHGVPFYSGWGLTRDLGNVPDRRGRNLSLDELVAGVLLLYPRYLDPVTGLPCPPEILIGRLKSGEANNRLGWVEPLRRLQGQVMRRWRAMVQR